MTGEYIHYVGFIGQGESRAVTVTIRRGTSDLDTLLLLTKVMEAIAARSQGDEPQHAFNEVRLVAGSGGPGTEPRS